MKRLLELFDDVIAPRKFKCLTCADRSYGEYLCSDCAKALRAMRIPREKAVCDNIGCAYRYDGVAKQLVITLKKLCVADAAQVLAEGIYDVLQEMQLPQDTVMTWVTMPAKRKIQRGIDHGQVLCRALSERCGFPVREILQRKGKIRTQRGLSREKRLRNLEGTFVCDMQLNYPVLLVDDVMTTGSTASACAEVLLKAGATQVYVIAATKATIAAERNDKRKVDLYGLYTS